ncbi:MAG TPA: hypothetical protein VM283_06510, partial [Armatimonadota bacterium]|nr:hypothetical protein [Armatimonadota bacterium]
MSAEQKDSTTVTDAGREALTAALKARALELGADLVGVGPVERWRDAPTQMKPQGHWPEGRYVVVVAIHHPNACVELGGVPTAHDIGPYAVQGQVNERLEYVQFHLARWLGRQGHRAMPIAATNIWRFRPYKDVVRPFGPDLSDIHAAACCGLGDIGYHGLLMTPEFGTWQRFCCMITDAPLLADPMYDGPALCDHCNACVRMCDEQCGGALAHEVDGDVVLQVAGKELRYASKNLWRCAWSEHFGLDAYLDIPEHVTEEVILENLAEHGRRGGTMGPCLKYCRPPHLRGKPLGKDVPPDAPADRPMTWRLRKLALDGGMAAFGVADAEALKHAGLDPAQHLPGCRSVILIGLDWPADSDPSSCGPLSEPCLATSLGVRQTLDHMQLDLARELERWGYFSLVASRFPADEALAVAGMSTDDYAGRLSVRAVLTQAPLLTGTTNLVPDRPHQPPTIEEMRQVLGRDSADLIGVAAAEDLEEVAGELRGFIDEDALKVNVVQRGPIHGQAEVEIAPREGARVTDPRDWLEGARSVVVLGMIYPEPNLGRAGEPPADAAGPYGFVQYQVIRDLGMEALKLARELEHRGYRAAITYDVAGVGSQTENPRFDTPDIFSGRFEAAAAGLGIIGRAGFVIHPDHDVRVRHIAIVTDAPIEPTAQLTGF